jgi:NADH-quinone oxidoreductase subunit E
MDISDITGVVLAGGTNSRYGGKVKANEIIGGERIISSILKTIRPIFGEIILVTNTPEEFADITGCIITCDQFLKKGPLGGIHAAMKASSKDAIFVFAGDMPFLNSDLIKSQISYFLSGPADAVIPMMKGNIEPLHALYRTNLVNQLGNFLNEGTDNMIRTFLKELSFRYFEVPDSAMLARSFTNINTPYDLQSANIEVLTPSPLGESLPRFSGGRVSGFSSPGLISGSSSQTRMKGSGSPGQVSGSSEILKKYPPERENLIGILHDIQDNSPARFISEDDMKKVADYLNITTASVYGIVTYYSMFSQKPRGKHIVRVCSSPVCEMTGSASIIKELEEKLSISIGETTTDRLFTLETCECLGHCEDSPGMLINDRFYGNLGGGKIEEIIDSLKAAEE